MSLGTDADIEARAGGPKGMVRFFDRDGSGAVDAEILQAAKDYATATIYAKLGASFPGVDFENPGPVPYLIRDLWARLVVGWAEDLSLSLRRAKREPGAVSYKDSALAELAALAANDQAQLPSGAPAPFADAAALVHAPAGMWQAQADYDPDCGTGGGRSGF
jgi:hypothetical protein